MRAAQLGVGKNGAIKLARAYTWAEPGYRVTQSRRDRFLLASCSKMFLAAAVQSLYDAGKLEPTTAVYPLLGFSHPADPRSDTITMQQLLDHTAGYDDSPTGSGFDPTYNMRAIALALGLAQPVTKLEIAKYMYGRPLDFAPGAKSQYSNYGYLLAGAVVERVTGTPYFTYVRQTLLQPADITQVRVISTRAAGRTDDEAIAEDQGMGLSPLDLTSPLLVPSVYGGDGEINEVGAPNDGTGASATALVQFIHRHAVWGNGAARAGRARRQHAGRVVVGAVARRRRRLGLRHQHARLAAGQRRRRSTGCRSRSTRSSTARRCDVLSESRLVAPRIGEREIRRLSRKARIHALRNGIPVAVDSARFEPRTYRAPNLAPRFLSRTIRALAHRGWARGGGRASGAGGASPGFDRKRERPPGTAGWDDVGLEHRPNLQPVDVDVTRRRRGSRGWSVCGECFAGCE